jgi:CheY-like chemotaxis protein
MSRKILLADDSLTIQKVVELTFADTDYEVIAVSSGDELLERLPETQPDIVICDVIMPGRDGYDVCQEIKSSSETLHLPVILLTGTFEPFDRDRALAAGCSEIITKPFEAKKLVETVEQLSTTAGAPPPATPVDEEDDMELDGQVTPPPPIAVPETTIESEAEGELEENDVRHEFDADAVQPEADFFADEAPAFEETAQSIAIEFDPDTQDEESSFALPDVEAPPDTDEAGERPTEDVNTVASDSWVEVPDPTPSEHFAVEQEPEEDIEDPFSSEADEQQPEEKVDEPFAHETDDEDPVQPDGSDVDEPPSDEERPHTMTTPIDVAAVMAQAEAEEEPTADDEDAESIEVDPSDADTQDVTEQAEEAEEAIAAETATESSEIEDPAQTVEIETAINQLEAEEAAESFELEAPEESVAVEPPSNPFDSEAPTDSIEVEAPEESTEIEEPAEPVAAEPPTEPTAVEAASLSDDDIDRIARRLLELAGDRIEHIAWEVIPDMAEIVVRERVRELEADSEQ